MKLIQIIFSLLLLLNAFQLQAQKVNPEKNSIIEQRIELIAEAIGDESLDFTNLFEALSNYYDHPINLNKATREELQELMLLTEIQITNLFDHLEKNKKLISIYELQAIKGWDLETIRNILPFVFVSDNFNTPHVSFKQLFKEGQHEWFTRYVRVLETQKGYTEPDPNSTSVNSRYLGNPDRYYTRYRFRFSNTISWGFTAEKDPGEEFFKGTQKNGFDFYSAHLFIRNLGKIKALAIGDYQVSFGQGLTFSTGLALGKNASTLNIKRNSNLIRPYTSAQENQFLRGAAISYDFKKLNITLIYSRLKSDANTIERTDTTEFEEGIIVSSLQNTGLHSTPGEIADKNAIVISNYGGHISYETKRLNIGTTAVYTDLGADFQRNPTYYNKFEFIGKSNFVTGIDLNYVYKNINLFSEISRSINGGLATQAGLIASLDPKLSLSLLYRNYQKNYQSLYTNALAEASRAVNERGLYIGIEAKFNPYWTLNSYFDSFESLWLRSGVNGPSNGFESLNQLTWKPNKKTEFIWRHRYRSKAQNTKENIEGIKYLIDQEQLNLRFQSTLKVSDALTLRNRIEWVNIKNEDGLNEDGFMIYQDVMYKPLSSPINITCRYALFNTDSYNSRIYAFENEVLYFYSIPAYYYRGSRVYGILQYQFRKRLDVWIRYGQFLYNNRTTVGSGLNEIQGNRKSEIKIQLRLSF